MARRRQPRAQRVLLIVAVLFCVGCTASEDPAQVDTFECPVTVAEVSAALAAPVIDVSARAADQLGTEFVGSGCEFAVLPPTESPATFVRDQLHSQFPAQLVVRIVRRGPADVPVEALDPKLRQTCRAEPSIAPPGTRLSLCSSDLQDTAIVRIPDPGTAGAEWVLRIDHVSAYTNLGGWRGELPDVAGELAEALRR